MESGRCLLPVSFTTFVMASCVRCRMVSRELINPCCPRGTMCNASDADTSIIIAVGGHEHSAKHTIHNAQCTIRNTQCSAQTQRESNNASNMRSDRRAHRQPPFLQHGQGGASAEAGGIATSSPFVLSSVTAPTETVSTISSASLPGTSSLQEKEEDMISARTAPRGRGRGKG